MVVSRAVFVFHGGIQRVLRPFMLRKQASGWLGSLFNGQKELQLEAETPVAEITEELSYEEALQRIAKEQKITGDWKTASLSSDLNTKGKILCSFERTFKQSIPNEKIASITTFSHLLDLLDSPSPSQGDTPYRTNTFPNIRDDGSLPPNLTIQFINTGPRGKPNRTAFQNYDSKRPEHANFLTKEEKERRKKKRRHLTSWK